jgi:hypothetical protein
MSFTYTPPALNLVNACRLLCFDTQQFAPDGVTRSYIFDDEEYQMIGSMLAGGTAQSSQFYSPPVYGTVPTTPVSYLRIASIMLDSLACNKARLAAIKQLLDVRMDSSDAAIQLRAQAQEYRQIDDDSAAIFVIEQVNTSWAFRDRFWSQVQRQQAGVLV